MLHKITSQCCFYDALSILNRPTLWCNHQLTLTLNPTVSSKPLPPSVPSVNLTLRVHTSRVIPIAVSSVLLTHETQRSGPVLSQAFTDALGPGNALGT